MPSAVWLQAVGLATGDSAPAVIVGTDSHRYIFNAGEGLQRFAAEHRVRLVKADALFFTSVGCEALGGLPGLLLTLADMGKKAVRLVGGPRLVDYLYATRQFMRRSDVAVEALEVAPPPSASGSGGGGLGGSPAALEFSDLTVEPVLLSAPDDAGAARRASAAVALHAFYDSSSYLSGSARMAGRFATPPAASCDPVVPSPPLPLPISGAEPARAARDLQGPFNPLAVSWWPWTATGSDGAAAAHATATPLPGVCSEQPPPAHHASPHSQGGEGQQQQHAVSYIVTTPPVTGKFHVAAARALGLPAGPAYGMLQRGGAVDADLPVDIALARGLVTQGEADAARAAHALAQAQAAAAVAAATAATAAAAGGVATQPQSLPLVAAAALDAAPPPAAKRHKGDASSAAAAAAAPPAAGGGAGAPTHARAAASAARQATVRVRVLPSMVKDEDVPGQCALIAACPSPDFLPPLMESPQLARFLSSNNSSNSSVLSAPPQQQQQQQQQALRVVHHLCPPHVAALPAYRAWVLRFPREVDHVFTCDLSAAEWGAPASRDDDDCGGALPPPFQPLMHCAQAHQLCKLHTLHPSAFPLPHPLGRELQQATGRHGPRGVDDGGALTPLQRVALQLLQAPCDGSGDGPPGGASDASVAPPEAPPAAGQPSWLLDGRKIVQAGPLHSYTLIPLAQAGGAATCSSGAAPSEGAAVDPAAAVREMLRDPEMRPHVLEALQQQQQLQLQHGSGGGTRAAAGDGNAGAAAEAAAGVQGQLGPHVPAELAITFTGTSSAVPSKYRNVSGIYVQLPRVPAATAGASLATAALTAQLEPPPRAIMLDCGEGAFGQLSRRFGLPRGDGAHGGSHAQPDGDGDPADVDVALCRLRVVWISHMHADHHLGLPRVIAQRARALLAAAAAAAAAGTGCAPHSAPPAPPLLVVGPTRLYQWLQEVSCIDAQLCGAWAFVDAEHFAVHAVSSSAQPAPAEAACSSHAIAPSPCAEGASEDSRGAGGGAASPPADEPVLPSPSHAPPAAAAGPSSVAAHPRIGIPSDEPPAAASAAGAWSSMHRHFVVPVSPDDDDNGGGCDNAAVSPPPHQGAQPLVHSVEPPPYAPGLLHLHHRATRAFARSMLDACGITRLAAIHVVHCFKSYAVRLDCIGSNSSSSSSSDTGHARAGHAEWSLVYSGDTRPCPAVVALGRGTVQPAKPRPHSLADPSAALLRCSLAGGDPQATRAGADMAAAAAPAGAPLHPAVPNAVAAAGSLGAAPASATPAMRGPCSLLIHEATFEDSEEGLANAADKRHSTASEALGVADAIPARHTLLTHFSARYPKLPVLKSSAPAVAPEQQQQQQQGGAGAVVSDAGGPPQLEGGRTVFVAYDLMTARGHELYQLPRLLAPLHVLFKDDVEETEGDFGCGAA